MLLAALLIDAVFGEPKPLWDRVPHPVVAIGRLISALEARLNRGPRRRPAGVLALVVVMAAATVPALVLAALPHGWIVETIGAAILLAHRSLVEHVRAVADGLRVSLSEGRKAVAMIVGRDPDLLDESGTARAAIESAAENFSDGVAAPVFWFAVAGLPGIALYKAVNTADSMIGHRTERYQAFGWASARLDDVLNWVPARLTGVLFVAVGLRPGRLGAMAVEAPRHKSVNAGWPEAGMAHVLDIALAGPRIYPGGVAVDDPFVNPEGQRTLGPGDIDRAIALLWRAWAVIVAAAAVAAVL